MYVDSQQYAYTASRHTPGCQGAQHDRGGLLRSGVSEPEERPQRAGRGSCQGGSILASAVAHVE